jgi:hypothetical protein
MGALDDGAHVLAFHLEIEFIVFFWANDKIHLEFKLSDPFEQNFNPLLGAD